MNYRSIDLSTLNQELSTLVCSVCLDTANKSNKNWIPAHGESEHKHHMCKECYEQVSRRNKKCPLCRAGINDLKVVPKIGVMKRLRPIWGRFWSHKDMDGTNWYLRFRSPRASIPTRSFVPHEGMLLSLAITKDDKDLAFIAKHPVTMRQLKAMSGSDAVVKIESRTSASVTFRRAHLKIDLSLTRSFFF